MRIIKKDWRRPIVRSTKPIPNPRKLSDPEDDWIVEPALYSTMKTGHQIWLAFGFYRGVATRFYYVWNPVTKLIDSKLEGHNHFKSHGHVIMTPHVDNRKGTKAKAHLIYQHLILGRDKSEKHIMVTKGKQTEGGKKIWQKLYKMRNISIHTTGGELIDPIEDEDLIWTHKKTGKIAAVNLVAHAKSSSQYAKLSSQFRQCISGSRL